jgi:sirohydrochlorin cobaltochelatase
MTTTALILFAHGSRDPEWAAPLRRVCALVRAQAPSLRVELAFLELTEPSLPQVAAEMIDEGFKRIVVLPMFIAQGGHLKHDLPQIIDEMRAAYPQVHFEQADALGDADAIVHAIVAHVLALAGV